MAVRTADLVTHVGSQDKLKSIGIGKILAVLVWMLGLSTTIAFMVSLGINLGWFTYPFAFLASLVLQGVLTYLESPIWDFEWKKPASWFSLAVDVFINFSGSWIIVKAIPGSGPGKALQEVTGWSIEQLSRGGITAFIVVFVFSLALAALPEALWKSDNDRKKKALEEDEEE
jgi:hypothetical protein